MEEKKKEIIEQAKNLICRCGKKIEITIPMYVDNEDILLCKECFDKLKKGNEPEEILEDIDNLIEDLEKIAPLILTENRSEMISFNPNSEKKTWLQLKTEELKRIRKEISKILE